MALLRWLVFCVGLVILVGMGVFVFYYNPLLSYNSRIEAARVNLDSVLERAYLNNIFGYRHLYRFLHKDKYIWRPARVMVKNIKESLFYEMYGEVKLWNPETGTLLVSLWLDKNVSITVDSSSKETLIVDLFNNSSDFCLGDIVLISTDLSEFLRFRQSGALKAAVIFVDERNRCD